MNDNKEYTYRNSKIMTIQPHNILCLCCLNGGGKLPFMDKNDLPCKLEFIKSNPIAFFLLQTSFDEIGARTEVFDLQNYVERKRDLDVLQKLGLTPGSIRAAKDLFKLVEERINSLEGLCSYGLYSNEKWASCPLAKEKHFFQGKEDIVYKRSDTEMHKAKDDSVNYINDTDRITIRAHHLLCIICFIGDKQDASPIMEDNLFEVWYKMKENPKIPVTLKEGCSSCMICPPCHGFDPERGLCHAGCHLRDRKKDLDVLYKLGLAPGDTLPANELISLISDKIPTVKGICEYGESTSPEWNACGGTKNGAYERRLAKGVFNLD